MYMVVCGFNGTVYSKHRLLINAKKAKNRTVNRLKNAGYHRTGDLPNYVEIVKDSARFTNIIPADNEFGCVSVSQKRWVDNP